MLVLPLGYCLASIALSVVHIGDRPYEWFTTDHAKASDLLHGAIIALMIDPALLTKAALLWVNRIRANELGLMPLAKLERGMRSSSCDCPIARSLKADSGVYIQVGNSYCHVGRDGMHSSRSIPLPYEIKLFISKFDQGSLPELIA